MIDILQSKVGDRLFQRTIISFYHTFIGFYNTFTVTEVKKTFVCIKQDYSETEYKLGKRDGRNYGLITPEVEKTIALHRLKYRLRKHLLKKMGDIENMSKEDVMDLLDKIAEVKPVKVISPGQFTEDENLQGG
jgi:hypothetical protein